MQPNLSTGRHDGPLRRAFSSRCARFKSTRASKVGSRTPSYPRSALRNSPMKSCASCERASCVGDRIAIWYWIFGLNGRVTRPSVKGRLNLRGRIIEWQFGDREIELLRLNQVPVRRGSPGDRRVDLHETAML